jgi:hypothetical protein
MCVNHQTIPLLSTVEKILSNHLLVNTYKEARKLNNRYPIAAPRRAMTYVTHISVTMTTIAEKRKPGEVHEANAQANQADLMTNLGRRFAQEKDLTILESMKLAINQPGTTARDGGKPKGDGERQKQETNAPTEELISRKGKGDPDLLKRKQSQTALVTPRQNQGIAEDDLPRLFAR